MTKLKMRVLAGGFRWSCDLGEPSVGCQFHLEKGEVSGWEGSCSISLIADEKEVYYGVLSQSTKLKTHTNTFDSPALSEKRDEQMLTRVFSFHLHYNIYKTRETVIADGGIRQRS